MNTNESIRINIPKVVHETIDSETVILNLDNGNYYSLVGVSTISGGCLRTDWHTRANELKVNMKRLEEITLFLRRHVKNMTEGKGLVELGALRGYKKSLDCIRVRVREGEGPKQ